MSSICDLLRTEPRQDGIYISEIKKQKKKKVLIETSFVRLSSNRS